MIYPSTKKERIKLWERILLLMGFFLMTIHAQAEVYQRRVIVLWDCSQSIVKRLDRSQTPPKTVWMATDSEMQRVDQYLHDILFRGIQNLRDERDLIKWSADSSRGKEPLVDADTLLTAYLFNQEREETSLSSMILKPGADLENRLRSFLPQPRRDDTKYRGLQTNLVRPLVDALEDAQALPQVNPQTDSVFLVLVTDNVPEGFEPRMKPAYIQKYLNFEQRRQKLLTITVACTPTHPEWNHQILIGVHQIWNKPIPKTPTPVENEITKIPTIPPTAASTQVPTAIPAPKGTATPYAIAVTVPTAGIGLKIKNRNYIASPLDVHVDQDPLKSVPLPTIESQLLDKNLQPLAQGKMQYGNAARLPASGELVYTFIAGKEQQWPASARLMFNTNGGTIRDGTPKQTPVYITDSTAGDLMMLLETLLPILVLGGAAAIYYRTKIGPPKSIRLQLTLNPGTAREKKESLPLKPQEPIVIDRFFKFPHLDCEPVEIVYQRGLVKGSLRIVDKNAYALSESSEPLMEEAAAKSKYLWTLPVRRSEEENAITIPLKQTHPGTQTWELKISIKPDVNEEEIK